MKELTSEIGLRLYISDDLFLHKNIAKNWENYFKEAFLGMFNTAEYIDYFSNHSYEGVEHISVLDTHGFTTKDEWYYVDGTKERLVQDWIDEHDGEATALVLFPCNPRILPIRSRKSLVLHQRGVGRMSDYFGGRRSRLYVPERGYIDPEPSRLEVAANLLATEMVLGFPTVKDKWESMRAFSQNAVL